MKSVAVKESPQEATLQPLITGIEKDSRVTKVVVWPEDSVEAWSVSHYNAANEQIGETVTERRKHTAVKFGRAQARSHEAELLIEDGPREGGRLRAALARMFR